MTKTLTLYLLLLSSLTFSSHEAGASFLARPVGAKAVGMGSAFTALADDATCAYYNPATLGFVDRTQVSTMNLAFPAGLGRVVLKGLRAVADKPLPMPDKLEPPLGFFPDMRHVYFGAVTPLTERDAVGIGYTYLTWGETCAIDPYGNPLATFETYDYAIILSYGRQIWNGFNLGASGKYVCSFSCPSWIYEYMYGMTGGGSAKTLALDIGLLYRTPMPIPGLSLGASYQNIGEGLDYGYHEDPLPKMMRWGIAFQPLAIVDTMAMRLGREEFRNYIRFICAMDWVRHLTDYSNEIGHSVGFEATLLDLLSFRWGYSKDEYGKVGDSYGYALNLGLMQFGVAEERRGINTWRVQVDFSSRDTSEFQHIRRNPQMDATAMILSSAAIPGGGQLYNGEDLKGLLLLSGAFFFAEWDYRENDTLPKVGLATVYAASLADAAWTLIKKHRK